MNLNNISTEYFRTHWIDITSGNDYSKTDWTPKCTKGEGRVFSYRVPRHLHDLKVITITLYLRKPVELYLHHPGQYLTWDIYDLNVADGQELYLDTIHQVNVKSKLLNWVQNLL